MHVGSSTNDTWVLRGRKTGGGVIHEGHEVTLYKSRLFLLVEVLQSLQHRRNVVPRLGVEPDLIHRDLTELKLTFLDYDPSPINSRP